MIESRQTTNEEILQAVNSLSRMGSDVAVLLYGIHQNNPKPPTPEDEEMGRADPTSVLWYSPMGVPDLAYGHALRIARAVNQVIASTEEMVERLSEYRTGMPFPPEAGR